MFTRSMKPLISSARPKMHSRQAHSFSRSNETDFSDSDVEKRISLEDEGWESDSSSQHSASTPLRKQRSNQASNTARTGELISIRPLIRDRHGRPLRLGRRYGRYFSVCLGLTLIILGVTLWQLSASSARAVQQGFKHLPEEPELEIWENFDRLERFFGGVRKLVPKKDNKPEWPDAAAEAEQLRNLTAQNSGGIEDEQAKRTAGKKQKRAPLRMVTYDPYKKDPSRAECFLDGGDTLKIPSVSVFKGQGQGMPEPAFGSHDLFGIKNDVCFERFGRLGPYGLGYSQKKGGSGAGLEGDREGVQHVWSSANGGQVDWRKMNWSDVQKRCLEKNKHRFLNDKELKSLEKDQEHAAVASGEERKHGEQAQDGDHLRRAASATAESLPRTVVLLRTWNDYEYSPEDLLHIRALISELSLKSGGEYEVHFLIHVKDDDTPIWADDATYASVLNSSLPAEFAGMGTLWSERQMSLIYGGLADSNYRDMPVHGVYRSNFMPLQWFSYKHPEFDFIWQWEMDVRYIGNYYELLDRVGAWAAKQPRKGLWERNARFYVPSEHGSWEDFSHMVRVQTAHGTSSSWRENAEAAEAKKEEDDWEESISSHAARQRGQQAPEQPIWGAVADRLNPTDVFESDQDPQPLKDQAADKYEWGVGEAADFITFSPLFDPSSSTWLYRDDVAGYNQTVATGAMPQLPPRRVAIGTTGRYSRRLLRTMHREMAVARHHMFSEMWPATAALHHGYKAVYAPHPVYVHRRWPTSLLAAVFNNGRNGATGGSRKSVFSEEQQHNFRETSWFYNARFGFELWQRWLGYKVDDQGGEEFETHGEGRMCLPSMLVHPVKSVEMVYEHGAWDEIAEDEERIKQKYEDKKGDEKGATDGQDGVSADNALPEN